MVFALSSVMRRAHSVESVALWLSSQSSPRRHSAAAGLLRLPSASPASCLGCCDVDRRTGHLLASVRGRKWCASAMSSSARSFRTPGRAHSAKRRTCRPAAAVLRLRSVLSLCSPAPLLRPPTARRAPRRYTAHVKQTRASDNKVLVHYDGWSSRCARRHPLPPAELHCCPTTRRRRRCR